MSPAVPGRWSSPDSHSLVFTPSGLGFPLGSTVRVTLPPKVDVAASASHVVAVRVPGGSETRLQQLLAQLGYLPLRFRPAAAMSAPDGRFTWRWNAPAGLRALWTPGRDGVMTRGALMAFQRDHDLTTDGLAGGSTWHALLAAAVGGHRITPDYSYVMVSRDGQTMSLWHDGRVILRTPVNTGIPEAPTAPGTYAVFEHLRSTTMSGTNPDGSHYNDPGVPWVSYFNGGDALHGFPRGTYGVAQSLGCVELPIGTAAKVWPYTPVGTLVTVA
jgi:peptidoglycan hydrolase-like protein with peptidoglycan-binding domain